MGLRTSVDDLVNSNKKKTQINQGFENYCQGGNDVEHSESEFNSATNKNFHAGRSPPPSVFLRASSDPSVQSKRQSFVEERISHFQELHVAQQKEYLYLDSKLSEAMMKFEHDLQSKGVSSKFYPNLTVEETESLYNETLQKRMNLKEKFRHEHETLLRYSYDLQFGESPRESEVNDITCDASVGYTKYLRGHVGDIDDVDMLMNQLFTESANFGQGMSWDAFLQYCTILGIFNKSKKEQLDKDFTIPELARIYSTSRMVTDCDGGVLYYGDFRMVALPKIAQKKKISMPSLLKDILNHIGTNSQVLRPKAP